MFPQRLNASWFRQYVSVSNPTPKGTTYETENKHKDSPYLTQFKESSLKVSTGVSFDVILQVLLVFLVGKKHSINIKSILL